MIHCVGVIGFGNISIRHRKNIRQLYPDAKIIGLSASGGAPSGELENVDQIVTNIDELINLNPNFVIVATPATLHAEFAYYLVMAKIPVLIEKPIVADQYGIAQLRAIRVMDTPTSVAYCLRYLSSAQVVKNYLDSGKLGTVYNVFSQVGQYLPQWRKNKDYRDTVSVSKKLGGGVLLELSHEFDYLYWFFGSLTLQHALLRNSNELNLEVEEIADITLTLPTGGVCYLHLDFLQKKPMRRCSIIGSLGRLEWDLIENRVELHDANDVHILYDNPTWDKNNMYLDMLCDFERNIKGLPNRCVGCDEAIITVELIENIKNQAQSGMKL